MAAPEIQTASKTSGADTRQLPPRAISSIVRRHDEIVLAQMVRAKQIVATYMTDFWGQFYGNGSTVAQTGTPLPLETRSETNRVWPIATTMAAALYPNAGRVALMPSYDGRGNAAKAQAALNDWGMRHEMQDRVLFGATQAILTGMIGWKVAFDAGVGRPTDRTYMTVVPRGDVVLDYNVTDVRQERYRGHILWMPRQEAEQKYGLTELKGTARTDPWQWNSTGSTFAATSDAPSVARGGMGPQASAVEAGKGGDTEGDFVRILEFYNLVDPLASRRGKVYRGRMEVYILDQDPGRFTDPIRVESMPFASSSGTPKSPIIPLIFASHPIYPYQAFSVLERMMPQQREYNLFRTVMAIQARRTAARKGLGRDGVLNSDQMQAFLNGDDAAIAMVSEDYKGELKDAATWFDPPKIDPALRAHLDALEQEMTWVLAQAPNFRGEVENSTKYEAEAANKQTEIELAMYARKLYNSLTSVDDVALRGFIGCMQDVSDSVGGFTPAEADSTQDVAPDVHVGAVGAVTTEEVVDSAVADAKAEDAVTAAPETGGVAPSVSAATAAVPTGTERTFRLKVDGVDTTVTVDDLDAEFEIEFVDGVRTPMREEAKKEAQINLSKPMMELWATAQKPGPEAAFARVQMQTLVESFSLPKSWSPESLDKLAPPPSAKTETPPEEDASLAGMPPAPAQKPRLVSASPDVGTVTASLQRAKAALESGDLPTAAKMLGPVAQMSPQIKAALDQAAAATGDGEPTASLLMVVNALIRGAPALAAQPQEQA